MCLRLSDMNQDMRTLDVLERELAAKVDNSKVNKF